MCIIINWYKYGLTLHDFKQFGYDDHDDAIKMHFFTKKNFTAGYVMPRNQKSWMPPPFGTQCPNSGFS
jgi:hypothetical protein